MEHCRSDFPRLNHGTLVRNKNTGNIYYVLKGCGNSEFWDNLTLEYEALIATDPLVCPKPGQTSEMVASLRGWLSSSRDPAIAPRPWRMFGDELRSTKVGGDPQDANINNSDLVATFASHENAYGVSNVAELYFVCELVQALPALLDEIERLNRMLGSKNEK